MAKTMEEKIAAIEARVDAVTTKGAPKSNAINRARADEMEAALQKAEVEKARKAGERRLKLIESAGGEALTPSQFLPGLTIQNKKGKMVRNTAAEGKRARARAELYPKEVGAAYWQGEANKIKMRIVEANMKIEEYLAKIKQLREVTIPKLNDLYDKKMANMQAAKLGQKVARGKKNVRGFAESLLSLIEKHPADLTPTEAADLKEFARQMKEEAKK